MGFLDILGGNGRVLQDFSWGKFLFNLFLVVVMIIGLINSKNQFDLVYEQGLLIEKSIQIAENDRLAFKLQIKDATVKIDSLVGYFEQIKGRVGRERQNFYQLVSLEINELRICKALLLEILEMSETDLLSKHNIKLEMGLDSFKKSLDKLLIDSKRNEFLKDDLRDFEAAIQLDQALKKLKK